MYRTVYAAFVAMLWLAMPVAHAQPGLEHAPRQDNPASYGGSGAPNAYRSAFEGYRAFKESEVRPWREVNEEVARIGGWKAYAAEAHGTGPRHEQPAQEKPDASVPADPHAGHHTK